MLERYKYSDEPANLDDIPEDIREAVDLLKATSFYAPVLTDTFISEAQVKTLLAASETDHHNSTLVLGARMAKHPDGYMKLIYRDVDVKYLRLVISEGVIQRFQDPKQMLLDHDYIDPYERLVITVHGQRRTGVVKHSPEFQQHVLSDIDIKFANMPYRLAPSDSSSDFNVWLLSEFVPKFLSEWIAPVANVPSHDLEGWI